MTRYLVFIFILILSCSDKTYLSDDDLNWQPYKPYDELIFESNKGELFKIYIGTTDKNFGANDHLDIFPDYSETIAVTGEYTLIDPYESSIGEIVRVENISLLYIGSGSNQPSIRFDFSKEKSSFYGKNWFKIKELENREIISKYNFNDVLVIEDSLKNYYHRDNHITRIYWSKKYGYIGYDQKNNYSWRLKKFIRGNKNIIEF